MSDLIYRQAAIDAASCECNELRGVFGRIEERLKALPSAEEESFEWCYTCKEYDQEKHCCHRWTKVIRNTVEELPSAQRTGRWIEDSGNIACSECHIIWLHRRTAFCPNCGARMEVKE